MPPPEEPSIAWHRANLLDSEQVRGLLRAVRPTHLLHLAWDVTPGQYWSSPANIRWVQASLELLSAFVENGGRRATFGGTCVEYAAPVRDGACVERVTPLEPASFYGVSKHALQLMVTSFANVTGMSASWARVFFPYGPHERPERLIPTVIRSLLRGEPAACSAGVQVRDFLYVEDVGDALAALLDSDVSGPINIGSGVPRSLKDMIMDIAQRLGRPDLPRLGVLPTRPHEPGRLVADVRRLTEEVRWRPTHDLGEGVDRTIAWWRGRP